MATKKATIAAPVAVPAAHPAAAPVAAPAVPSVPVADKHPGRVYFVGFVDGDTAGNVEAKIHGLGGTPPGFIVVAASALGIAIDRFDATHPDE